MNAPTDKKASLDLGAMMEQSMDTIPDAPEFTNPPAGEYRIGVKECKVETYQSKKEPGVDKQRVKISYFVESTLSIADSKEQPVPDGSMFSETFMGTEEGLGYLKTRIKNVMNVSDMSGVTLKDMMESVKGQSFDCRIAIRKTKDAAGQEFENLQIRVVAPKVAA